MSAETLYSHKFKKQEIGTYEEQKVNLTEQGIYYRGNRVLIDFFSSISEGFTEKMEYITKQNRKLFTETVSNFGADMGFIAKKSGTLCRAERDSIILARFFFPSNLKAISFMDSRV